MRVENARRVAAISKYGEKTVLAIVKMVSDSFHEDARTYGWARVVATQDEIRERTNICYDWFVKLRREHRYSTQRTLDFLPRALRATLDKEDWVPPPVERSWTPPKVML